MCRKPTILSGRVSLGFVLIRVGRLILHSVAFLCQKHMIFVSFAVPNMMQTCARSADVAAAQTFVRAIDGTGSLHVYDTKRSELVRDSALIHRHVLCALPEDVCTAHTTEI